MVFPLIAVTSDTDGRPFCQLGDTLGDHGGSTEDTWWPGKTYPASFFSSDAIWEARCLLFDISKHHFCSPGAPCGTPFWHLGSTLGN